jgi:O-antigen/teichoic acid export membrane protein
VSGYYDRRNRRWVNTGVSAYYGNAVADLFKVGVVFLAILAVLAVIAVAIVGAVLFGLVVTLWGFLARKGEMRAHAWDPLRSLTARARRRLRRTSS